MANFLTKLRTEKIIEAKGLFGRALHQLVTQLSYRSSVLDTIINVPIGFATDFASVPRLPFMYSIAGDRGHASAVVHDYLLVTRIVPRSLADLVFAEALKVEGVPWGIRHIMYVGVRLGTLSAWLRGKD